MSERDEIPTKYGGEPLYDLGFGVYAEWWTLTHRENWGVVEHHWCQNDDKPIGNPGLAGYWAMGSIPVRPGIEGVAWDIQQGERGSFENLTLTPSVLCKRCGLHGFIQNGKWVPA